MFFYWSFIGGHPSFCNDPECATASAYLDVSMVASCVAFGCLLVAAFKNWPRWLRVAAAGASYVAVAAGFAAAFASGLVFLPLLTIMLAVLPTWLLLTWRPNQ